MIPPVQRRKYIVRLAAVEGKLIGTYEHPGDGAEAPAVGRVIELSGRRWRIVGLTHNADTLAVRPASV
jgi:hypothetical protein